MSTLEKLFMQIFDRKQWISGQLRQQVDSYEESLACNLAASGRELPSWLFDDGTDSRFDAPVPDYSNRTELNRKHFFTDLLYPPSRATPIPSYKPTQSCLDSHLTGPCFSDNHIQNLQINEEIPSTSPEKCNKEQSQIQPDMTNIGALSTIQRSRSRQKDIEKRSSVKRAPVDTTSSFRQTDNTKAEIHDKELIETSNHCRMEDGKERKRGETESSACQIMNPDLTETLDCVETAVIMPKGLTSDAALTVSRDTLDSVTEKHSEKMNQRSQFHSEKDLSSPVGEFCRIRDSEKRKEAEALKSSTSHLIIPVLTETLNPVETSAFEPKRLAFSLAFDSNLHSVVENHDETRDGSPGSVLEGKPWYPNGEYSGMRDGEERIEGAETLVKVLSPEITAQEVNSWPKRRKMEVSSNFAFATSPRPRKRLVLPEVSYCLMEEDEPETSVLVLEEYNRVPSMSSSSADNGKASISPTEPNIGSPTYDANHFSISPKGGDVSNTLKYVPEIDALIPQEDDLANSSKDVHEIDVYTSSKYDGGSFIEEEDGRPELEAFTISTSSDSEGETRSIIETIPLQMERTSLAEQLSSSLCNLASPGTCFSAKYELDPFPNEYKSLPTGHFDFMKTGEALSVPVNDRKQLSASATSIPYKSGPFGYPGFTMGLSTSGKSGKGRSASTTPGDKVGYRRGIPPLTPPAQKYSYGKLSEINESENGSGKGSGIRSSGKTPLYPDSTCFRIDEDAAEDDVPNDTNTLDPHDLSAELEGSACFRIDEDAAEDDVPNDTDTLGPRDLSAVLVGSTCFRIDEDAAEDDVPPDPRDLSAILEESTLPSVNDSQNLLEDDDPNYQNTLRDITAVFENTEIGAAIPENFSKGGGLTGKKAKQSVASLNKRELGQKASRSMQSGLVAAETIQEGREKSMAMVSSKTSNIVSDVTSFVPLVKQKQQPVAKKREVRIPALEAAEANKRLEEKKRNERELQKAAMKAEREKLNQEKVLKKKLVEEQKKKEAGMAVKKRQREERDKKEKDKEKKRKCIEIDREQTKKEPPRRARVVREEKEVQCNVIDDKEQSKRKECGKEDAFVRPRETGSSIIIIDDIVEVPELPRVVEKSYEMSPYKDSDAEGDDGLDELEEDQIRRKKYIPLWARKEFLEDYLHSRKYMNPELIFSCKRSFDMSKVLKPHNQKQRF